MLTRKPRDIALAFGLTAMLLGSGTVEAQAVRWDRIIGANTGSMSKDDRSRAASLMNKINCYYGCSDTVARCLVKDLKCQTARRLGGMIVRMVTRGRSDQEIRREVMFRAKSMHPFKKQRILYHSNHCTSDPSKAKVVVTAFSEFQCPFCTVVLPWLRVIVPKFGGKVVLCYKHFPTTSHGTTAVLSSQAATAAGLQGKFWPMHDILYKNRKRQESYHLITYARSLGLDMNRWQADWKSRSTQRLVVLDKREGLRVGVQGTPTLFINGKQYHGRKNKAELTDRIAEELHLVAGGR